MTHPRQTPRPTIALIGLGRVGANAPAVPAPDGSQVLRNHLDAIQAAGGRTTALVDPLAERREQARARCDAAVCSVADIAELDPGVADVIAIATPADVRPQLLADALQLEPKAVLLEKPLAHDLGGAERMLELGARARTDLLVCYNRRTDPGIRTFAEGLDTERVTAALFRYGKGLTNYGSHLVDHILQWFGPVKAVQSAPCSSGDPDNSCVSFRCLMRSGLSVEVLGVPNVRYDMFEAEIYLPDAVVGFRNNGAEKYCWEARKDLFYPGYWGLVPGDNQEPPLPIGGFVELYAELFESIAHGKISSVLCTAAEALEIQRVLTAAVVSAREGGRTVLLQELGNVAQPREGATPFGGAAIREVVNEE